jgi:uncharacterized protein involved in copper resistance
MKLNFLKFGFYAVIFSMAIFVTSCESGENDHNGHDHGQHQHEQGQEHDHEGHDHEQGEQHQQGEEESSVDQLGKEFTLAYVCPMHCEGSGSDKEGTCPTCKMTYIANADHDGH